MRNFIKTFAIFSVALIAFLSCTVNTPTVPVYKLTETENDASRVLHFQQSADGLSYVLEDKVVEDIPAGTKVEDIQMDYEGFDFVSMSQTGTSIYIFYDRKVITYTFHSGEEGTFEDETTEISISGLYGAEIETPDKPVSSIYKFVTWVTEGGDEIGAIYGIDNLTLNATWRLKGEAPEGFVFIYSDTVTLAEDENLTPASTIFTPGSSTEIGNLIVCKTEVTVGEFLDVMGYAMGKTSYTDDQRLYPVNNVTWYEAIAYCNRRSIAENLDPCYTINGSVNPDDWGVVPTVKDENWEAVECSFTADGYRLPTLAEWEYLARANESIDYANITAEELNKISANSANSKSGTAKVGSYEANAFGIFDMIGNVWEWCWDTVSSDSTGNFHQLRGGSYQTDKSLMTVCEVFEKNDPTKSDPPKSRAVNRNGYKTQNNMGFRVIRTAF